MSTQKRDHSIEFLRVLAIILIIASHCKILEQGGVGNCIFFALSGFFIVAPFKEDTELAFLSPKEWLRYIGKRLLRVLPAYYTYLIAITYLLGLLHVNDFETVASLPLHLCFYMASGHLWFIQQEMLFFLLCPLLMCLLGLIRMVLEKRKVSAAVSDLILAGVLILLCVLSLEFLHIMLHGNNTLVRFMPERIMAGMVFGYMVKALRHAFPRLGEQKGMQILTDGYVILFVLFCLLSSEWVLSRFNPAFAGYYIGWSNPFLCIILTGI
ncbi:MAG: acyltransferase family protein, partial [Lachnospiraceae bacterium]|nr:acyltransferase family protein [Lachnospiraceae bacterium]